MLEEIMHQRQDDINNLATIMKDINEIAQVIEVDVHK